MLCVILFVSAINADALSSLVAIGQFDYFLAIMILVASMYAFISRKTFMPVCILLLCFPVTYIIPMLIAAFLSAKASSVLH